MIFPLQLCLGLLPIACGSSPLDRSNRSSWRPVLWMGPPSFDDGNRLRELFEHPDEWKQTRARVFGVHYADVQFGRQFSDPELRTWFQRLNQWGLKLSLEVGAVKPWGTTGDKTFGIDRKLWDRFRDDGAHIDTLAMDEPLAATRDDLKQSADYAVDETAKFIALVRRNYPRARIGDIEPYPSFQADELLAFIDALQAKLKGMNVRGLDFFRLDVDWMHFVLKTEKGRAGWQGVRSVETGCRKRGIPFSLIYWAADYPQLNRDGRATEETWETSILTQKREYAAVGGAPDEIVIQSWLDTPVKSVPETASGTFTKSILDFIKSGPSR